VGRIAASNFDENHVVQKEDSVKLKRTERPGPSAHRFRPVDVQCSIQGGTAVAMDAANVAVRNERSETHIASLEFVAQEF